ncbi:hypothetical protein [Paenibacillus sp. P32E]|uniref:hypothetical protein n=1 Tax=Paenibacillus sp. P32E TaxID=1349434 RepID=UPI0011613A67|nr:hypothetical protein [Paenibacillus sp. P32E]
MLRIRTMILSFIRSKHFWLIIGAVAAGLFILIGGIIYIQASNDQISDQISTYNDVAVVPDEPGVKLPVIKLPETKNFRNARMIGLIYYNGKVYTQTDTEIAPERAKDLLGEKLGTAKGNIEGWDTQDENDIEFASTIHKADVYTVNGYDKDFRIMTLAEQNGMVSPAFYERLNGISVRDGGDFFGRFNIKGNVVGARYQSYSEWNNSMDQYHPIKDMDLINTLVDQLYHANLLSREIVGDALGDFRNDDKYRRLIIQLSDGTEVSLKIIRNGYINYGFAEVYFIIDSEMFWKLWQVMQPI